MATYCISDIHGNLKALKALLEKIQFKYDGSDRLIIVGDIVDWGRVEETDNPMKDKLGDNKSILVYGHTITNNYDSIDENGKCKIYINLHNQKICIDCGGKVLGKKAYARLACLRLDDLKEYYIEEEGELSNAE